MTKISSSKFKDHFSVQAEDYSIYRPEYPPELYAWLASICPETKLAWDCATGNGQAAVELSKHFSYVIGTDASQSQIDHAMIYPRVEYEVSLAENSSFKDQSVNIVTVAQALHWFNFEAFFDEVKRVLKKQGILCVWCYELHSISTQIDPIIQKFYREITGSYWPNERKHIEAQYQSIDFPFEEIKSPKCHLYKQWTLDHLMGYFGTWSATQKYLRENNSDPRDLIADEIIKAWGNDESKRVTWPVTIRTFRST
ncbi:MAG: class I SAM-dependent methyltransferase [Proteobacteria bacterium]|nr:class I SAM-dependent methyltransferase [Pseudomonadota bacterium]